MTETRTTKEFVVICFFWMTLVLMITFGIISTLRGPVTDHGERSVSASKKEQEIEEKIAVYKSILADNPDSVKALVGLGDLYFDSHRFREATATFLKAQELAPDDVHVANDLGLLYLNTREQDKAMAQFRKALQLDPTHLESLYYIGMIHASRGEFRQSVEVLGQVLKAGPSPALAEQVNREMAAIRQAMQEQERD